MNTLGQPKQHVPIFVGSTYEDMIDYRSAVKEALHRLEAIVRGMEYFGSKPGSPKEECLKSVRSCRVYIGIFAMRYGSIDAETGKSMTHLEYEEACKLKLPCLIYLIDEQKQPVLPKFVETGDSAERLKGLKEELKKKFMVSFFTTPDDLAKRITQDLPPILQQSGVSVSTEALTPAPEETTMLLKKFKARPRKHADKEVIIDLEVQGDPQPLGSDECSSFRLSLGDAIERRVKCDALGNYPQLIAVGDMADWLEGVPNGTKAKVKIRLLFGQSTELHYDEDNQPYSTPVISTGFRLVGVLEGEKEVEPAKTA
jgi:hypothetical protein